jgi:hypothetical protein
MKSGKDNKDAQRNEQTGGERECNAILFGSSGFAIFGLAEDKKDSRACPFCQDLCCPTRDGAEGKVF